MPTTPGLLEKQLEGISQNLINAFTLTYSEAETKLADPLLRWMDFRMRRIDPTPRQVLASIGFWNRAPSAIRGSLTAFIDRIRQGADLNAFLSKTTKGNDTSGRKRQWRTDHLWADWQIHHAHLPQEQPAPEAEFCERSDWLLFFVETSDVIALIDVRPHESADFADISLIELAIRSWPEYYERFRMKGALGSAEDSPTDAASIKQSRSAGIARLLCIDGAMYLPPGTGPTTAATATRVTLTRDRISRAARAIEAHYLDPENFFAAHCASMGESSPQLAFVMEPAAPHRLGVCSLPNAAYTTFELDLPPTDARYQMQSSFLPDWARERLSGYLQNSEVCPSGSMLLIHEAP